MALKGVKQTQEHIDKRRQSLIGRKLSEEHKQKISHSQKGKKYHLGKHHSEEIKRKLSESHKGLNTWSRGKKYPTISGNNNPAKRPEVRKKISESRKGMEFTKEHRIKLSIAHGGDGTGSKPYTIDWTYTLKRSIRERDNYICQLCSQYGNFVHHIDYDKKNCNPANLITLCNSCHTKTNVNRNYWTNFFQQLLKIKRDNN